MRYMILIRANPDAFAGWGPEQYEAFGRRHLALSDRLSESGELVAAEGLAESASAHTIAVRDGEVITSDGPFAEVKEHLAGFLLVDVEGFERAVEIAAEVPDAELGGVELRPVLDLRAWDL
jgi:hypothetical protein